MKAKRLIIQVRQDVDFNHSFGELKDIGSINVSPAFSYQNDSFLFERADPLKYLDAAPIIFQNEYYRKLGTNQKKDYRTFKIDCEDEESASFYFKALSSNDSIETIYFDGYAQLASIPNDLSFQKQQALNQMQCEEAWDISNGIPAVIVAILDSGINSNHEDLKGRVLDKLGFKLPAYSTFDDNSLSGGHGTGVAGIVSASWNNFRGVVGVSPNSSLLNGKIFNDGDNTVFLSDCLEAMNHSILNGAQILNCSWEVKSNPEEMSVKKFIEKVNEYSNKVVLVFAAGNGNVNIEDTVMGHINNCLKVGALTMSDTIWKIDRFNGSNYGKDVVFGYGDNIFGVQNKSNSSYGYLNSGTSLAAPHISGVCALIKAYNTSIHPTKVIDIIKRSCERLPSIYPLKGIGKVNAFKALKITQSEFSNIV